MKGPLAIANPKTFEGYPVYKFSCGCRHEKGEVWFKAMRGTSFAKCREHGSSCNFESKIWKCEYCGHEYEGASRGAKSNCCKGCKKLRNKQYYKEYQARMVLSKTAGQKKDIDLAAESMRELTVDDPLYFIHSADFKKPTIDDYPKLKKLHSKVHPDNIQKVMLSGSV